MFIKEDEKVNQTCFEWLMWTLCLCNQYISHLIWKCFKDKLLFHLYPIRLATLLNKPGIQLKLGEPVSVPCTGIVYVFPADFTTCSRQCQPDSFISRQDSLQKHTHAHWHIHTHHITCNNYWVISDRRWTGLKL